MSPTIATILFVTGIGGLFFLARDRKSQTSKALWIPIVWFLIAGSRPVSGWLQAGPTPWAALPGASADEYTESNLLNSLIFLGLLTAGLIVLARRERRVTGLLQANLPIVWFFSYCAVSTMWSEYAGTAFRHWTRSLGDLVMVLIVLTEIEPMSALKRLLACEGFLLLPISILFIKYYPGLGQVYSYSGEVMYNGVTEHKNALGAVCMVVGLGFLWRFLEHYRSKGERYRDRRLLANGTGLAMVMWLLWLAKSATASSCFLMAAALLVVTSLSGGDRKLWVVHFLVVVVLSLPIFALFLDPTGHLVQSVGRNSTLTGRTAIWHHALSLAGNPLFGTGFESFWLGNRLKQMWILLPGDRINEAHNGYLEVYLNLGWCGLTLLALVIVAGYRNVIVALRGDRCLGAFKLAYFVAAVIYNLTEAGFRMSSFTWIFFLLVVVDLPKAANPKRRSPGGCDHTENLTDRTSEFECMTGG